MNVAAVVVMGVSGAGKSVVGAAWAAAHGATFIDGDDLHPATNIDKMRAGHPLSDGDRWPWLDAIAARIDAARRMHNLVVIACSALRFAHRERLRAGHDDVVFVFLDVDAAVLRARLGARVGHFMPAALLDSQLDTLERPAGESGVVVVPIGAADGVAQVVERIDHLRALF